MGVYSPLTIDTIEMVVTIGSAALYKGLWAQLHAMHEDAGWMWPQTWKVAGHPVGYAAYRVYFEPASKRRIASIELGVSATKHRWMKVTLFPNNFRGHEFQQWQDVIAAVFAEYGYARFFFEARVSRLDLAVDVYFHHMDEFVPYIAGAKKSHRYTTKGGLLSTLYLGSARSKRFLRIYDKAKQLAEVKKKKTAFPMTTRVEATLRSLGCAACELHELVDSPFLELKMIRKDVSKAAHEADAEWQAFLDAATQRGSADALRILAYKRRRMFRKRLAALPNSLPEHAWAQALEKAVEVIVPAATSPTG